MQKRCAENVQKAIGKLNKTFKTNAKKTSKKTLKKNVREKTQKQRSESFFFIKMMGTKIVVFFEKSCTHTMFFIKKGTTDMFY